MQIYCLENLFAKNGLLFAIFFKHISIPVSNNCNSNLDTKIRKFLLNLNTIMPKMQFTKQFFFAALAFTLLVASVSGGSRRKSASYRRVVTDTYNPPNSYAKGVADHLFRNKSMPSFFSDSSVSYGNQKLSFYAFY